MYARSIEKLKINGLKAGEINISKTDTAILNRVKCSKVNIKKEYCLFEKYKINKSRISELNVKNVDELIIQNSKIKDLNSDGLEKLTIVGKNTIKNINVDSDTKIKIL